MIEAAEGARNCAIKLAGVTLNDDVLILTDAGSDLRISEALAYECSAVGADVTILVMKTRDEAAAELPKTVAEAVKVADILFTPVSNPPHQFSWEAISAARKAGVRWMPMIGLSIETLCSRGARFPPEVVFEVAKRIMSQLQNSKTINVTCKKGSNLSAKIVKPEYVSGGPVRPMQTGDYIGAFAGGFGVIHIWPEWTADGVIFFDALDSFEGKLATPLKCTVRNGRATRFEGQEEQVEFMKDATKCENGDHFAELGLGINPALSIRFDAPVRWEAERHAGCLHCGIGRASRLPCKIHIDGFVPEPTILIDDEPCVKDGKLLILEDSEIRALSRKYGVKL